MMKLTDVCSSKRSSELIMIATFRDASILQYYTLLFYNYYDQHGCHRLFLKRKKKFHFHIQKDAVLVVWHYRFTILIYTPIGLEKTFAFLATNQFQNWHSTQLGDKKGSFFYSYRLYHTCQKVVKETAKTFDAKLRSTIGTQCIPSTTLNTDGSNPATLTFLVTSMILLLYDDSGLAGP